MDVSWKWKWKWRPCLSEFDVKDRDGNTYNVRNVNAEEGFVMKLNVEVEANDSQRIQKYAKIMKGEAVNRF